MSGVTTQGTGPRHDDGALPGAPEDPRSTQAPPSSAAPGPVLRLGRRVALPVARRPVAVGTVLVVLVLAGAFATLTMGGLGIEPAKLFAAVFGGAEDGKQAFVLGHLRGPRLVVAVGAGIALGLSGALFQSVTRNPLGSPDVIGVSAGAGAGAALFGLLLPGTASIPLGSVLGAAAAVGLVALGTGTGFGNPLRMILAGIGVSAMAAAFTQYVVYVVARDQATMLSAYLNGSLEARSWGHAATIGVILLVCAVPLALLSVPLALSEMGDDVAQALGSPAVTTRRWAVLLSVVLAGGAVAVAGPIAFISLTAPHIARRLARSGRPQLLLSGVTGALLLVVADLVAQQAPWAKALPVGILTLAIGGVYLGALLVREFRKGLA
ncbi:iron chelate uptake ABC transporter family permease subunit [Arthrobacter rhombi]|uniref:FecCD family ABC transporter permease n=1 Tax=Arthrobacter rhombi TaxID=71253 RepID=UPI0031D4B884